jgi:hypothetical protein
MAGETKPQATATAPVASSAAPSAPTSPTEVKDTTTATPPTTAPTKVSKATDSAQQTTKAPPSKDKPVAPPKRQGPQGPEPTAHATEAELDRLLAEYEKGEPKSSDQTDTVTKATTAKPAKAAKAEEIDPLQKELDEANEAAAKVAGLTLAPKPGESTDEQDKDRDAPEDEAKDEFQTWLDTLPKGAKEKITRQQKQIRELKGQASEQFKLTPTPSSPLAHVSTEAELQAEVRHWKTVQVECQRLIRTGTQDGVGEITLADGKKHTFQSDEEIQDSLEWADLVTNAAPDWRERLNERSKSTPWEAATKLAPDLFEKGSPSHDVALDVLERVPAFKAAFPDYEVRIAHMARSMKMEEDQKPTKEFPHGKARYVRLELDSEGRVIQPTAKVAAVAKPNTKPVTESVKDTAPSPNRPALKQATTGDDVRALTKKYEQSRSDEDLDALLRASERVAA